MDHRKITHFDQAQYPECHQHQKEEITNNKTATQIKRGRHCEEKNIPE